MTRDEVYKDMEEQFGMAPSWIKSIPDEYLAKEWHLMKMMQLEEKAIPNKYKQLIGVAAAATAKCPYCAFFHAEAARLNGATDEEIQEAIHFAKMSAGWSAYLVGMQTDIEQFKKETHAMFAYAKEKHQQKAA
ncbi:MAG: carboxymuconolactone decarboxylase family protein [Armatimonadetes bacterium]|nr:carboxymuconolactone decarboxylase family protein [Armatimonadota bacterium]